MTTTEMATVCPHCGRTNDAVSAAASARRPRSGAVALCWFCRGVGVFDDGPFGLHLRKPTDEEQAHFDADPNIRRLIAAMDGAQRPAEAILKVKGRRSWL